MALGGHASDENSVLCEVCNHVFMHVFVCLWRVFICMSDCMRLCVCVHGSWCANRCLPSAHSACVPGCSLLRTLWFLNQPCSTLAATDKSCLSHHGGFLFSIQTHSVSPSLPLFTHFFSSWCNCKNAAASECVVLSCFSSSLSANLSCTNTD